MTSPRRSILDDPALHPYTVSHSAALATARLLAADHDRRDIRTLADWLAQHEIALESGSLGPSCLGLSIVIDGARGIAVSDCVRCTLWRQAICWHELGHLLTGTARSVVCRPDDWLTSRLERLAWCAGAVYAVSAFDAVQIGWNVTTVERVAETHGLPVELVTLRVALGIRDREIPLLRMDGARLVEAALRAIAARCRRLMKVAND
jgi:hypothetical protein